MISSVLICCSVVGSTCSTGHLVQRQVVHSPIVRQVVKQQVAHSYAQIAPNYAATTLYFVGAPVRVESFVEQQKRADPEWQEFQQFKAWKAGAESAQQTQQQTQQPPPMPQPVTQPEKGRMSLTVSQACGQCHGKADPDGGFYLDGQHGIEAWRITAAIRAIGSGEMPKNRKLTSHEKNQLLQDLLSLESQDDGADSQ